jgi:hypothetical protein
MTDIHCAKVGCEYNNDSACGREVISIDKDGGCLLDTDDSRHTVILIDIASSLDLIAKKFRDGIPIRR